MAVDHVTVGPGGVFAKTSSQHFLKKNRNKVIIVIRVNYPPTLRWKNVDSYLAVRVAILILSLSSSVQDNTFELVVR